MGRELREPVAVLTPPHRIVDVPVAPPPVGGGVWGGVMVGVVVGCRVAGRRRSRWCRCGRGGSGGRAGWSTRRPRARSCGSARRYGSSGGGGTGTGPRGCRSAWDLVVVC